jgi:hypothetical protein
LSRNGSECKALPSTCMGHSTIMSGSQTRKVGDRFGTCCATPNFNSCCRYHPLICRPTNSAWPSAPYKRCSSALTAALLTPGGRGQTLGTLLAFT